MSGGQPIQLISIHCTLCLNDFCFTTVGNFVLTSLTNSNSIPCTLWLNDFCFTTIGKFVLTSFTYKGLVPPVDRLIVLCAE